METDVEYRLRVLEENYRKALTERESLLVRIWDLEDTIEDLTSKLSHQSSSHKIYKPKINYENHDSITLNNSTKKTNSAEDEPWLFYWERGRQINAIKSTLRINYGHELHANTWRDEKGMWIELLKSLYGPGNEIPDNLKALRKLIAVELSSACHNELLIVVRGVPSNKTEKS